jgi:hypothetical protein
MPGQPVGEKAHRLAVQLAGPGALSAARRSREKDAKRSPSTSVGYPMGLRTCTHVVWRVVGVTSSTIGHSEASSLVTRLARLGWTRIGSPGIFG